MVCFNVEDEPVNLRGSEPLRFQLQFKGLK